MKAGALPPRDGGILTGVKEESGNVQVSIKGVDYLLGKAEALRLMGEIAATLECMELVK
jgi:hypothetical protein